MLFYKIIVNLHSTASKFIKSNLQLSDFFDILPLAGGDKPRHYKQSFTEQVGVGFIPTRELACIDDDYRFRGFKKSKNFTFMQTVQKIIKRQNFCTRLRLSSQRREPRGAGCKHGWLIKNGYHLILRACEHLTGQGEK
jgi:hypothetical protein